MYLELTMADVRSFAHKNNACFGKGSVIYDMQIIDDKYQLFAEIQLSEGICFSYRLSFIYAVVLWLLTKDGSRFVVKILL